MLTLKAINYSTDEVFEKVLNFSGTVGECIIGRTPGCGLQLNSPEISRVHGRILFRDGQYWFTDLGSTDGSRLNNEMLLPSQDMPLAADDLIRIGEFVLVIQSIQIAPSPTVFQRSPSQTLTVHCVQIIDETADVKTFRFAHEDDENAEDAAAFDYLPGQFVTLHLPIEGQTILRSYSISSAPSRPDLLEITVKRVAARRPDLPPGLASNWLHDQLCVGTSLQIQGPFGQFTCGASPAPKLLLVSAGSGITPMMSMTRWICDRALPVDIVFVYSARTPADWIFARELQLLEAQHANLTVAVTTTRTQPGQSWFGYRGRLNAQQIAQMAPDFGDRQVFVCGPTAFMAQVKSAFETLGLPATQYHEESFGSHSAGIATHQPKSNAQGGAKTQGKETAGGNPVEDEAKEGSKEGGDGLSESRLIFRQSGEEIVYDTDDSILELAEAAGVAMTSACRMGACGVCKQKLCEGEVEYSTEPSALSSEERAAGDYVLPCVARPKGRVAIEA